jgi:hypothetical protein
MDPQTRANLAVKSGKLDFKSFNLIPSRMMKSNRLRLKMKIKPSQIEAKASPT